MRTEPRFLIAAGLFGAVVAFIYWFLSYEDAGFTYVRPKGQQNCVMSLTVAPRAS